MLSWQLASLMMAHSRKMTVTPGGSILCCGELVASRPKKPSNQLLKRPCSFASRSLVPQLNGGSRTLHTPAFDRRQIVKGNATFGAGQRKAHCLHVLNRTGIGRLIDLSSPAAGPIVQWQPSAGMSVFGHVSPEPVRPPRTLEPLYGGASAHYRDVGNKARHLSMHHLAPSSDGLVARRPSEYELDLHGVTLDQRYACSEEQSPHGRLNIACRFGHHSLACNSHIGSHR
ncbi:hypothetical protein N7455_009906 [Penicillium solitum]|uniref:uncharacterized protein n=1 Tax=Penicillium solitum TaxID=60172 RepID=UPI0032C426C6|nr:hypothetical protein N7455_009906 [Penicillium solitum]